MPPIARLSLYCAAAALAACATRVQVQSVPAADGARVHELRGHQMASLQAQAQQLCPRGYQVLREWAHTAPRDPAAGPIGRAWGWLTDQVGPGEEDQAQLLVQCV